MNNYGNNVVQKDNEKCSESKPDYMEIFDVNDREFKIAVLKILNKIWENAGRQFNVLRKEMNEWNEYFIKWLKL